MHLDVARRISFTSERTVWKDTAEVFLQQQATSIILPSNSPPLRIDRLISCLSFLQYRYPNHGPIVLSVLKSSGNSVLNLRVSQHYLKWTRTYSKEAFITIRTTTTYVTLACRMRLFVKQNFLSTALVRNFDNRPMSRTAHYVEEVSI
jgi:hypothetical protein